MKKIFYILTAIVVIILVVICPWHVWFEMAFDVFKSFGLLGNVCFVVAFGLLCVTPIPSSTVIAVAGAYYGLFWGTVLVTVGEMLGILFTFILVRKYLGDYAQRYLAKYPRVEKISAYIEHAPDSFKLVVLLRLNPLVHFGLVNYMMSLSKIKLGRYMLASFIGIVPSTIFNVYLGEAGWKIVTSIKDGKLDVFSLCLMLSIIVLSIAVFYYIRKITSSALERELK